MFVGIRIISPWPQAPVTGLTVTEDTAPWLFVMWWRVTRASTPVKSSIPREKPVAPAHWNFQVIMLHLSTQLVIPRFLRVSHLVTTAFLLIILGTKAKKDSSVDSDYSPFARRFSRDSTKSDHEGKALLCHVDLCKIFFDPFQIFHAGYFNHKTTN